MNKLKEINGKFYQEAEVVMLAINKNLKIGDLGLSENNILWYIKESNFKEADVLYECKPQHLYFLIAEEIKEGDWIYHKLDSYPSQVTDTLQYEDLDKVRDYGYKKIIAATDLSLETESDITDGMGNHIYFRLPQPSQSFIQAYIKAYNEGKPITKVLVEYWSHTEEDIQLKVNSSNEITIKKIKDSYTREEVIDLLEEYRTHLDDFPSVRTSEKYLTNWVEKYL